MKKRKYSELAALKGRMREKKKTYRDLSEKMKMSSNTFNDKINGFAVFNIDEVFFLVIELEITESEVIRYFFPHMLRNATSHKNGEQAAAGDVG